MSPTKKLKRAATKTSSTSSDSDYDAVDDISASEEDEPDVERADAEAFIDSYLGGEDGSFQLRPDNYDNDYEWQGFPETPQPLDPEPSQFEDQMRMSQPNYDTAASTCGAINGTVSSDSETTPVPRRVRFNLESDEESDIGEFDTSILFLDQESLRPEFRREIEQDNDGNISSDGGQYEWSSDENDAFASAAINLQDESSSGYDYSSGYDSDDDEGDTTDEEIPENAVAPARSVLRRPSLDSQQSDTSTEDIPVTRRPQTSTPRMGTWKQDRSIPFVMFDNTGKKLLRFQATAVSRRTSLNSIGTPLKISPIEAPLDMSPMLSNPPNLMISGMASIDQLGGGPPIGPIEAFYPFTYVSNTGKTVQDSPSSNEMDDDDFFDFGDDTQEWDMNELVDLDAGDSDEDPSPSSDTVEPASTPARPATGTSEDQVHPLINHFNNPNVVGAFRSSQRRHQQLTRDNHSLESLAFADPLGQGIVRGFKGGRMAAANKPLTPRRKALQQPIGSSPGSPLGQSSKRKFGGDTFMSHKRHRSAV